MGGLMNNPGGGRPVPGADVWQLPDGSFQPMHPMQIAMRDILTNLGGGGMAGQAGTDAADYNSRLKRELDKMQ